MNEKIYFKYDVRGDCPEGYKEGISEKKSVLTAEQRARYELNRRELSRKLRPYIEVIKDCERLTAEELNIIVNY